ncbi:MAG TPA: hypothetical protein VFS80_12210 [Burkholderiales bacterium]|nr:hypothetical protein [Burkholderiales bacterium]
MGKSGSELLVYGLIIAGFLLFNYLAQRLAKKAREQQEAAQREAAQAPPVAQEDALEDIWGRLPAAPVAATQVPEQRPVPRGVPPPSRPAATRRLFRTRQDLRHAIVLMTVLGPCRALEPPEQR